MPNTIADNLRRLQQARSDIADAITEMGGTVNTGDGYEEFPDDIRTIPAGGESSFKSTVNVATEPSAVVTATRVSYILKVYAPTNSALNITDGYTVLTGTGAGESTAVTFMLPFSGTWAVTAVNGSDTYTKQIAIAEIKEYELKIGLTYIYGASWSGGSETTLTRTDDAAEFDNPDPYVNDGAHPGSSPFDNIMPWSGMTVEAINDNLLVKIPKFWYKITTGTGNAISFQIANYPADGFNVSPAHQDRDDGVGERDYIYVGRYHSISGYKSKSGAQPLTNITRATGRSNIKNLGTGFYLWDYATLVTIWLLYIVEFANWNSQTCIGYGCSSDGSIYNTGATSSMTYHTGTTATSRTSYASGCQYRYIEDLWGNVLDWCDGIRFSSRNIYVYKNPSEFSDSSGGTNTGTRPTSGGYISSWNQPSTTGYDWAIYPGAVSGSNSTYVPDYCSYDSSGVVLRVGGSYDRDLDRGLFFLSGSYSASDSNTNIGVRVMYLPPNS